MVDPAVAPERLQRGRGGVQSVVGKHGASKRADNLVLHVRGDVSDSRNHRRARPRAADVRRMLDVGVLFLRNLGFWRYDPAKQNMQVRSTELRPVVRQVWWVRGASPTVPVLRRVVRVRGGVGDVDSDIQKPRVDVDNGRGVLSVFSLDRS